MSVQVQIICRDCGTACARDSAWSDRCHRCQLSIQVEAVIRLEAENRELRRQLRDGGKAVSTVVNINQASFRRWLPTLIQLCHPDKHDGSTNANDATDWLLKQRQEVKS